MGVEFSIRICCTYKDEKKAEAAETAIAHEGKIGRAETKISREKNTLEIIINSRDIVSLRATANAFLRALSVFEEVDR